MSFYEVIKAKMISIKQKKKISDDDRAFIEFYNDPEIVSYVKEVERKVTKYDTTRELGSSRWRPRDLPLNLDKKQYKELKILYDKLFKWYNEYENKSERMILEFNRILYYGQEFSYRKLKMLISFYTKYTKIKIDLDRIINNPVKENTNLYRDPYEIDIDYSELIPEDVENFCHIDDFKKNQYWNGFLYRDSVCVSRPRTFRINKKDPNIYECMINTWCNPKYEAVRTYIISRTTLDQIYFYFTTKDGKRCVGYCSFNYQKNHPSFFGGYKVPYFYPIWPQMHYEAAITRITFRKYHDSFSYSANEIGSIYCKPMPNLSKIDYCRDVELFDDIIKKSYRESQYRFVIFSIKGYYHEKQELYIPAKLVSINNTENDLYWCPIWEKIISKELIDDNIVFGMIPANDPIVTGISIEPMEFPNNICD